MREKYFDFDFKDDIELMKLNYDMQNKMNLMNNNRENFNKIQNSESYNQVNKNKKWDL